MVHVLFVLYKNPPKSNCFLMYVIVIQTEAILAYIIKISGPIVLVLGDSLYPSQ